jgi:iron complex transport system substrate-binding protein
MIARRALLGAPLLLAGRARAAGRLRVVTLGGAVTETVFALGAGATVVGTDLTSLYPPEAAALPRLGYVRQLGAEGVLSLRPDLVLATADAGPPAALEQVMVAGVALVRLEEARDPQAACARIRAIGTALDRGPAAEGMAAAVAQDVARVRGALPPGPAPRVLFLLSAGRAAPMAAGSGTAAAAMIALAGGANAIRGLRNYRALSAEAVIEAAPDVIVTTADTLAGVGGRAGLLALPGLDGTPAARTGRLAAFDGLELLGFGPRLPLALAGLARALHPGIALPPLPVRAWAAVR